MSLTYACTSLSLVPAHHCFPGIVQKCFHGLSVTFSCLLQSFKNSNSALTFSCSSSGSMLSLLSKIMSWGWRHDSEVMSTCCSHKGLEFGSQHQQWAIYSSLWLQLQEPNTLFWLLQVYPHSHAHTHVHEIKRNFKKLRHIDGMHINILKTIYDNHTFIIPWQSGAKQGFLLFNITPGI